MKFLAPFLFTVLLVTTSMPLLASAQGAIQPFQSGGAIQPSPAGGAIQPAGNPGATYTLVDPLGNKNFCDLAKSLLNVVMAIGLPVAVFFLVWSGFRFILARGKTGELETARKNFYYVIIGIAVFLGAWTLASILAATIQTLDQSGAIQFCTMRS
jgi:hypothetical protein